MDIGQANSVISIIYAHERCEPGSPCGQSISNKRPSRFVILSAAKDLSPDRDPSLRSELALERSEGMTLLKRLRLTRKTSSWKWIGPCGCQVRYLLASNPNAVIPASPRQNQPGIDWCSTVSIIPPAISARNTITQEKLPIPEALLSLPLSLPPRRPRRRDLPLRGLSVNFTSICPVSSLVMTRSIERGKVSSKRPASIN